LIKIDDCEEAYYTQSGKITGCSTKNLRRLVGRNNAVMPELIFRQLLVVDDFEHFPD